MADNGEKLDKDTILSTPARRIVFNALMQGLRLEECAKQANLGYKYTKNMVARSGLNTLVRQEQAKIAEKTGITVAYCQNHLIDIALEARRKNKLGVAKSCFDSLLKTIGGFKADEPNPKTLRAKELDTEKAKALKQAADWFYHRKYLAVKQDGNSEETVVDWIQNDDFISGSDDNQEDQANQPSFSSEKQGEV